MRKQLAAALQSAEDAKAAMEQQRITAHEQVESYRAEAGDFVIRIRQQAQADLMAGLDNLSEGRRKELLKAEEDRMDAKKRKV